MCMVAWRYALLHMHWRTSTAPHRLASPRSAIPHLGILLPPTTAVLSLLVPLVCHGDDDTNSDGDNADGGDDGQ
jgi:hypothetical protein